MNTYKMYNLVRDLFMDKTIKFSITVSMICFMHTTRPTICKSCKLVKSLTLLTFKTRKCGRRDSLTNVPRGGVETNVFTKNSTVVKIATQIR